MKNIGIVIPTRGRNDKIKKIYNQWFMVLDRSVLTDCIVVIDEDDECNYERLEGFRYIISPKSDNIGMTYPLK
jgi:hypothetical protein